MEDGEQIPNLLAVHSEVDQVLVRVQAVGLACNQRYKPAEILFEEGDDLIHDDPRQWDSKAKTRFEPFKPEAIPP